MTFKKNSSAADSIFDKTADDCHENMTGTRIPLESLPNTRDLGGIRTADGRIIRPHRLVRSGALAGISDADREILLNEYNLKTVIDFRTDTEREEKPDPEMEGVRLIIDSIAEEETMGITRGRQGLLELLNLKQDADALMLKIYPELVGSELSQKHYARFFEYLLAQEEGAVLWHCSAGKDRAGLGSALVLAALGVPESVIRADYLLTNDYLQAANRQLVAQLSKVPGADEEKLAKIKTIFDAKEAYLDSALDYIKNKYGTMREYLEKALGMDEAKLRKLQQMYLMEAVETGALKKHMIDTVKEWQLKIGYMEENMKLYYPAQSLKALLGLPEEAAQEELDTALAVFAEEVYPSLGRLKISHNKERYCLDIPAEGCAYIAREVPEPAFLKQLLAVITAPGKTLSDVRRCFADYAAGQKTGFVEEDGAHDGMGHVFYFEEGADDCYVYCVEENEFGLTYHRFGKEDYEHART